MQMYLEVVALFFGLFWHKENSDNKYYTYTVDIFSVNTGVLILSITAKH